MFAIFSLLNLKLRTFYCCRVARLFVGRIRLFVVVILTVLSLAVFSACAVGVLGRC